MVGAEVKVVGVSDLLRVAHLNLGGFDPLSHLHIEIQIVVHCIVIELLLFHLLLLLTETCVDPL